MNELLKESLLDYADKVISAQICYLSVDDSGGEGTVIRKDDRQLINMGNCGYLGLEHEKSVKEGSINAINNHGLHLSSSRAYISSNLYQSLEEKLTQIFDRPVVLAQSTHLIHLAVLPLIIDTKDLLIVDQQVHRSVQVIGEYLSGRGVTTEYILHSHLDQLSALLDEHKHKYQKVWYLADGIYSMFGDRSPNEQLLQLLKDNEQLHIYFDDAHGMSCFGEKGEGWSLSGCLKGHPRVYVATSLRKGFGAEGAVFTCQDEAVCKLVRHMGGPVIFGGPISNGGLGAANVSADIHLSGQLAYFQNKLNENIKYCQNLLELNNLPVYSDPETPIFFIGVGDPDDGVKLVRNMMDCGFYCNIAIFPAVSKKHTGLRFTLTARHTTTQIENFVETLKDELINILTLSNKSIHDVDSAFERVAFYKRKAVKQ
ncbi:aminotransferase class I/II-fold pyridoxal phosphate-dependent enzyme [Zooshikella harenae]|uniref:Aminotransferase class I/II-fold pyridoxal phosphate-dependent enzyme n=1 Tax=Zooshikella harenae TaxID=2827238 RepID=A0ABS5ZBZ6_9GAMM|nr:aminotransferase class I/II-fold pyridoxal phosphate-dependent enzyme [Zooshikella harenae]MBU2710836.1 aminotransferase class I/II-fold pyridoxal phosphate-dependent enzyme [Zooshikella harenae]